DESKVRVIGLNGVDYADKVLQQSSRQDGEAVIRGEVDRVYANVKSTDIDIHYGADEQQNGRGIKLSKNGLNDIVVWNPWIEKSAGMADFGDEEYHRMICVEAGQVAEFIALASGDSWEGSQVLSLL
ncbi:hypothetical protein BX616_003550, partial [Lobosporangium transversale]